MYALLIKLLQRTPSNPIICNRAYFRKWTMENRIWMCYLSGVKYIMHFQIIVSPRFDPFQYGSIRSCNDIILCLEFNPIVAPFQNFTVYLLRNFKLSVPLVSKSARTVPSGLLQWHHPLFRVGSSFYLIQLLRLFHKELREDVFGFLQKR